MRDINLSDERYLAALIRIRDLIAGGLKGWSFDDDTPGDKDTQAAWGLCNHSKEAWPDPVDYLWPNNPSRVAPLYLKEKQCCPLSRNLTQSSGCFYSCKIFRPKGVKLTREEALKLYDAKIKEVQSWLV